MAKASKMNPDAVVTKKTGQPWEGHVGTHSNMLVPIPEGECIPTQVISALSWDEVVMAQDENGRYWTQNCQVDSGLMDPYRIHNRIPAVTWKPIAVDIESVTPESITEMAMEVISTPINVVPSQEGISELHNELKLPENAMTANSNSIPESK